MKVIMKAKHNKYAIMDIINLLDIQKLSRHLEKAISKGFFLVGFLDNHAVVDEFCGCRLNQLVVLGIPLRIFLDPAVNVLPEAKDLPRRIVTELMIDARRRNFGEKRVVLFSQ
eukprot:TRINITY_DN1522_c0_g1_i9.p1 TRINITY_DN1522_c0_g1~~TRINITY_DN1522_c0_g1_i9.p1  ORF type:complete len:113 (+),score=7.35 TRINITY_DN1522_c0_g1_i9:186-524(+)